MGKKQSPLPCDRCGRLFRDGYNLRRHRLSAHATQSVKAEVKPGLEAAKGAAETVPAGRKSSRFFCSICKVSMSTGYNLRIHRNAVHSHLFRGSGRTEEARSESEGKKAACEAQSEEGDEELVSPNNKHHVDLSSERNSFESCSKEYSLDTANTSSSTDLQNTAQSSLVSTDTPNSDTDEEYWEVNVSDANLSHREEEEEGSPLMPVSDTYSVQSEGHSFASDQWPETDSPDLEAGFQDDGEKSAKTDSLSSEKSFENVDAEMWPTSASHEARDDQISNSPNDLVTGADSSVGQSLSEIGARKKQPKLNGTKAYGKRRVWAWTCDACGLVSWGRPNLGRHVLLIHILGRRPRRSPLFPRPQQDPVCG